MAAENFKVKKGLEVGTGITANSDGVNVTGIITATQFKGDGSGLTGVVGSGSGIVVKDEGSAVGTAGTINFVGSGVAATLSAGTATVTVNAGGLDNVVEDTTPELGGDLNLNSKFITGSGGINVTGVVTATTLKGNGDFVDIDVDGQTEVDDLNVAGIATGTIFKVPDATNAAGATNHIAVGDSSDLKLYHDNNGDAYISNATGHLTIRNNTAGRIINLQPKSGANGVIARYEGAVELYHNGNQKLTTTINGIEVPDLNVTGVGTVGRLDTDGVVLGTNSTTFAAKFADDAVANFGDNNDFQLFHDGDYSRINSINHGIIFRTNMFHINNGANNKSLFKATNNLGVELYYNDTKRFETDQAGVKITGVCTATSFSGSAAGLTSIPSAQLSGALPSLDGSALTGITASGTGIVIQHDGSNVGTAGTINFSTNLDVSAVSAGIVTVTASGTSGVSLSGSTNNTVATVTGANALIGEANLRFDGSTLDILFGSDDQKIIARGTNPYIRFKEGSTDKAYIQWHSGGYFRIQNQEDLATLRIKDDLDFSTDNSTFYSIFHEGNDGSGSGLDADLLDGQEGSYYTNASNLASGTIPNGRFPATLPATSGANLTALNASEITSGTLPIARIADNAVTFAKMQDVGTGVLIGRDSSGSGDIETLTAAEARTLLNVADGATAGGDDPADTDPQVVFDISASGSSGYIFTGPGNDGSTVNPDIYLQRGQRYRFINTTGSAHPFEFRNAANNADYTDGITGSQSGTQDFNVQYDAPAQLKYRCTIHTGSMVGNIYITGQQLINGADNRLVTASGAYGLNGEANLTFNGSDLSLTGTFDCSGESTFRDRIQLVDSAPEILLTKPGGGLDARILNDGSGNLIFGNGENSDTPQERLRIDSNGKVSIASGAYGGGGTTPELYVSGTSGRQMKIHNSNAGTSSLQITNGTTGQGEDAGTQLFTQGSTGDFFIYNAYATGDIAFGTRPSGGSTTTRMTITSDGHALFSDLTDHNDPRNVKGISLKSPAGISFQNFGANGSKNWRIRPDDQSSWGGLDFSVGDDANSSTSWPSAGGDLVLSLRGNRDVHVDNGNLVIGTAGKGIDFSATSDGVSGVSELLDDYEEGSFTPTLKNFNGTYSIQVGRYTKVGNIVHYNVFVKINSAGDTGTPTGINMPFDNGSGMTVVGHLVGNESWNTNLSESNITTWMPNGSNEARFYKNSGKNLNGVRINDIGGSGEIAIAGSYRVS